MYLQEKNMQVFMPYANSDKLGYIYKITNLINNKIYIGQRKRLPLKTKEYYGSGKIIKRAIKKYGNKYFIKEILNISYRYNLNFLERFWIQYFKQNGHILYNIGLGGLGNNGGQNKGKKLTEDTKEKIRQKLKNRKRSEDFKNKISKTLKEKYKTGERISALLNTKVSKSTRQKMSKSHKGKKFSEEHKLKLSNLHKGKQKSEEHRQKLRKAKLGKSQSREHIEKRMLKIRGRIYVTKQQKWNRIGKMQDACLCGCGLKCNKLFYRGHNRRGHLSIKI